LLQRIPLYKDQIVKMIKTYLNDHLVTETTLVQYISLQRQQNSIPNDHINYHYVRPRKLMVYPLYDPMVGLPYTSLK